MRKIKIFIRICLILSSIMYFCLFGHAHMLWLNVSNYYPTIKEKPKVYIGWGHRYPVDDFLAKERLKEFLLILPSGRKEKLNPNPGGFLATELKFSEIGTYIVSAVLKPGFYTMYIERGKIHHKSLPKTGLKNVILSLYFEQYAKALINVEEGSDSNSFSKSVGHKLEIIPLKNPYKLKAGDFLPVQVIFKGKPLKYCRVYGTYSGFSAKTDFCYATVTNDKGVAEIRILHHGPWLIKADVKFPVTEDLKGKCNEIHYTATLSFEVL